MKNSKKIISLALTFALLLSMLTCLGAFTASAASEASGYRYLEYGITYWYSSTGTTGYTSGTGTEADPFIVTTAAQLRHLARGDASGAGKYYKLGNDIEINDTSYEDWYLRSGLKNWIKGKDASGNNVSDTMNGREFGEFLFRSNLDGDGHTISGLYINYEGTGHMETSGTGYKRAAVGWALFPSVNGATIKNLKLKDVYIKSNISQSCGNQPHGYGALIGYSYYAGANVSNVQIENVKYDIQSPNQAFTNYRVGVGSIIGYSAGPITATDCIVKNISGKAVNKYFTGSGKPGSAGSIIGFVAGDSGCKHTLTNIISIGRMNPLSAGVADPAFVTTNTDTAIPLSMPIRSGSSATNVYAIGDVSILASSNITKAVDEAAFKSTNLDTFYNNIGGSTNWSEKNVDEVPYLKLFPPVEDVKEKAADVLCDFGDYSPSTSAKALSNWTIVTESGNKVLKGDFTDTSLVANNFGFIVGSYAYGVHGPLVPGKIYKLEFRAKADENASMDYAVYNGSTYAASSRDYHIVTGGYDEFGKRTVTLTTGWQTYTSYFTFDSYTNTADAYQGTKRPFFFVQPNSTIWGNAVYFDDIVLTACEGTSFAASANHYYEPTLGDIGDDVTLIADPEKENYIFDGWYTDTELTDAFNAASDKVSDGLILYEKWAEALTEFDIDPVYINESGADVYSENLFIQVTSSNSYPVNFDVSNNSAGSVILGFATASDDDFGVANSPIWQKDITGVSGTFSVLLTPNTCREDGVRGDTLYLYVKYTDGADIEINNFSTVEGAPTVRRAEFDVNGDNAGNVVDLVVLKKMAAGDVDRMWLGDIDGNGIAAMAGDLTAMVNGLIGKSDAAATKHGRSLVWNEEFSSTSINSANLQVKYPDDKTLVVSNSEDNYNYNDGKLNLNITRSNSTYKIPYDVVSRNKMSFKYGYIEISAKMSFTPGQWSAFWLSGIQGENTYQGEIDIFETVTTGVKPDLHSWDNGTRVTHLAGVASTYTLPANFDKTAYHTYGFEWDSTNLKFYVDDYCYYTLAAADINEDEDYLFDGVLDQYYYLLLSNSTLTEAMSADSALPRMSIDYIRLYQKAGELINVAE